MNIVDYIAIGILAVSLLFGFYRGFVASVLNTGGGLIAFGLSFVLYPKLTALIQSNDGLVRTLLHYTDFTSFSKLHTDTKTNNCKVTSAQWRQVSPTQWVFEIEADRFLRNMVRAIVGTLLMVGRGKITLERFKEIIEKKERSEAGDSAMGQALFLEEVKYPEEIFI